VTAGHDSYFNASTPVVAGVYLASAFAAIGIDLDSRNVALGNNPCTPYDVCVKFFAGMDADIVHWEQSYFCDGQPIIEQFIRQAHSIPSRPLVIFSDSNTGKWYASEHLLWLFTVHNNISCKVFTHNSFVVYVAAGKHLIATRRKSRNEFWTRMKKIS